MRERRSEVRMLCADMLEVRWKSGGGRTQRVTALLEDISTSGACLQLEDYIPLDAEIWWECPGQEFSGHVRYCVYREIGYFAGVEFEGSSKWSKKSFEPRHMLDPRKLLAKAKK
jgi:hypothetical protein